MGLQLRRLHKLALGTHVFVVDRYTDAALKRFVSSIPAQGRYNEQGKVIKDYPPQFVWGDNLVCQARENPQVSWKLSPIYHKESGDY